jgi:hypothetical protein
LEIDQPIYPDYPPISVSCHLITTHLSMMVRVYDSRVFQFIVRGNARTDHMI